MDDIDQIAEFSRSYLDQAHDAREAALAACRRAVRCAANSIRATHRGDWGEAGKLLDEARDSLRDAIEQSESVPQVRYAGFISDAEKEVAEASITLSLIERGHLPSPAEVGVGVAEYLGGVAESVGELRRHLLDSLRSGEIARGERVLQMMDSLYQLLATMDYPDSLTRGLRSRTDAARGAIERSRSDLTITAIQHEVAASLAALHRKLEGSEDR
jgi:translin